MNYQNILVTLDGSELAELALQHVPRIANPGAQVHVLSVLTTDFVDEMASVGTMTALTVAPMTAPAMQRSSRQPDPELVYERESYLLKAANSLQQQGYNVTTQVLYGNVVNNIVSVAADGYDVLVMATHGRSGLSRLVMGSIAEAVLHKAECPVLLIPAQHK
ncbi:MAG: universal stress protein [Chloroflexota bacterium]